jgi:hypothetical protein
MARMDRRGESPHPNITPRIHRDLRMHDSGGTHPAFSPGTAEIARCCTAPSWPTANRRTTRRMRRFSGKPSPKALGDAQVDGRTGSDGNPGDCAARRPRRTGSTQRCARPDDRRTGCWWPDALSGQVSLLLHATLNPRSTKCCLDSARSREGTNTLMSVIALGGMQFLSSALGLIDAEVTLGQCPDGRMSKVQVQRLKEHAGADEDIDRIES